MISVLKTAIPVGDKLSLALEEQQYDQSIMTATAPPPWFSSLPSSFQTYLASIVEQEVSILASDATAPTTTITPNTSTIMDLTSVTTIPLKAPAPVNRPAAQIAGIVAAAAAWGMSMF